MSDLPQRPTATSDARILVRAFRIVATLHGAVFVTFVVLSIAMYVRLGWRLRTLLLALVSSLPPFATIAFEVWAARTGRFVPGADRYSDFPSHYPTSVR